MRLSLTLHPFSSELYELLYIPLKGLRVGITEIRIYVAEQLWA